MSEKELEELKKTVYQFIQSPDIETRQLILPLLEPHFRLNEWYFYLIRGSETGKFDYRWWYYHPEDVSHYYQVRQGLEGIITVGRYHVNTPTFIKFLFDNYDYFKKA